MITNLSAIILAAGSSKRFGKQKLCEKLPSGNTVLGETIFRVERAVSEVRIITNANVYASINGENGRLKVFPEANIGMG